MEADWEVEIGAGAPVIDVAWLGYIDLVRDPGSIGEIAEAVSYPPLAETLFLLNAPSLSAEDEDAIRTLKCDLWPTSDIDPDEMEAVDASSGFACYIDLAPRHRPFFSSLAAAEQWSRRVVSLLRSAPCPSTRVDLVIRRAVTAGQEGLGITAYLSGCGASPEIARAALHSALKTFSAAVAPPRIDEGHSVENRKTSR